jgi:hypothetical protein
MSLLRNQFICWGLAQLIKTSKLEDLGSISIAPQRGREGRGLEGRKGGREGEGEREKGRGREGGRIRVKGKRREREEKGEEMGEGEEGERGREKKERKTRGNGEGKKSAYKNCLKAVGKNLEVISGPQEKGLHSINRCLINMFDIVILKQI